MLAVDDVVAAVYHAGGGLTGVDVAASCHSSVEAVDVPLAEAVTEGYLERATASDGGRMAFRITAAGIAFVEGGQDEPA